MVLPGTWTASLYLLFLSVLCFSLWPNLFKLAPKWRFELFSIDFAAGALVCATVAAFTLGTMGSDLNFSDSMLVAGRRAELMAAATGIVIALGCMLYLATVALVGLAKGTLLSFSIFGCVVSLLEMIRRHRYIFPGAALCVFALSAGIILSAMKGKDEAATAPNQRRGGRRPQRQFSNEAKGTVTGILAGLTFSGVLPVLKLSEYEQLGIGAYGGVLLATVGLLVSTLFLDFFFLNISLEGGDAKFSSYFSGTAKNHLVGALSGFVFAAGSLALYTACTGTPGLTRFYAWMAPFAEAVIASVSGLFVWRRGTAFEGKTLLGVGFLAIAAGLLVWGMRV